MRKKERGKGDDELVEVDDNAADNAEHNVVGELTGGVVEEELDRTVSRIAEREFSVVIIIA